MIFTKIFSKSNISLLIFIFINFIFAVKYISRVNTFYLPISILFSIFYLIIWYKRNDIDYCLKKIKLTIPLILICYLMVSFLIFHFIKKESLNVDRWSVISSFWDNYFQNKYVYFAKSFDDNNPGPMPFYFILALPFYLIGELGIFSLLGILIFVLVINKNKKSIQNNFIAFCLIGLSLFYIWEICCRSNIFLNGSLVLFSIYYYFKNYQLSIKYNLFFGLLFGLLLSTRNVFVIPYLIMAIYSFRANKINFKNGICLIIIAFATFVTTFLPFVYNHINDFLIMNPFTIQSAGLMPLKFTLFFILLSIFIAFKCKHEQDVYFYSGISLFLTIVFYFCYNTYLHSFNNTFFESFADISYFILCTPFFIYYLIINDNKVHNNHEIQI